MALQVRPDRLPCDTGVQSARLFETSQLLSALTAEPVQANKAIVGRNAFAHEAGIHQDGVLKDARTYEIMKPEDVGQSISSRPGARKRHSGHIGTVRCDALDLELTNARSTRVTEGGHLTRRTSQGDRRRRPPPRRARAEPRRRRALPRRRDRSGGGLRARRLSASRTRFQIAEIQIADWPAKSEINLKSAV